MNILLITPKFPKKINEAFNITNSPLGGWIDGLINNIDTSILNLSISVFDECKINNIKHIKTDNIDAYKIDYKDKSIIEKFFNENIYDVIHVVGIEHKYIKDIMNYLPFEKTLINITGIQYEYEKYFFNDFSKYNPLKNPFLSLNMFIQHKIIQSRGKVEKEILKRCKYVVGRTEFDKKSVLTINPSLKYFSCNEILRDSFYTSQKWNIEKCTPKTIFVSQGSHPIKAAHKVIEIVSVLKEKYPEIKCYIAGENLVKSKSILTFLGSNYASIIKSLIKKYKLKENIIYTGFLSEEEMVKKMLECNVFLMPSSIENSVNSLQEAMLLGMPCVSSLVGGVSSLVDKNSCLTYKFNDINDAVIKISMILDNTHLSSILGESAIKRINKIADKEVNIKELINIYKNIIEDKK